MNYTILDFNKQFPTDQACLDYLLELRFGGKRSLCPKCGKTANFSHVKNTKKYACSWCGKQISPTAGTIFNKSKTSLIKWFYAIFLMSQSRNGISAKEIERCVKIHYETAHRMMHQIRKLMTQGDDIFTDTVEMDETYIGGRAKGKRGRGAEKKVPVFGISQRYNGKVYAQAVGNVKASTLMPIVRGKVKIGTEIMTDEMASYKNSASMGYQHNTVNHSKKEYVRGNIHTNNIEGFWSQLKRSVDGTHHAISSKYLQNYLDEFVFRWNNRTVSTHLFDLLLAKV